MTDRKKMLDTTIKSLENGRIVIIQGLRRIGKTTMIESLCDEWSKKPDLTIVKYRFSNYFSNDTQFISNAFKAIDKNKNYLFFFDEFQDFPDWNKLFMTIHNDYQNIKVIATGSVSYNNGGPAITEGGRYLIINMYPLSFSEYMDIHGNKFTSDLINDNLYKYLTNGSYPSKLYQDNIDNYLNYIYDNIVEKVTNGMLLEKVGIESTNKLMAVLKHIITNLGGMLPISNISKELGITIKLVEKCINYLVNNFIIFEVKNSHPQQGKAQMWSSKYYLNDHTFYLFSKRIAFDRLLMSEYDSDREYASMVFENAVLNQFRYNNQFLLNTIFFVKNKTSDIDIAWEVNGRLKYFEVKLTDSIDCLSKSQIAFSKENKLNVIYLGESTFISGVNYINVYELFENGIDQSLIK